MPDAADRHLLFGLIALQVGLIAQSKLVAALQSALRLDAHTGTPSSALRAPSPRRGEGDGYRLCPAGKARARESRSPSPRGRGETGWGEGLRLCATHS